MPMPQYNHRMIVLARESRGLTQKELVEKVNTLNQGSFSRVERDELRLSDENLNKIAEALSFPLEFFYQSDIKTPVSAFYYRKRASLMGKALNKVEATINILRKAIDKLLDAKVEMDEFNFLKLSIADGWKPETAASAIRNFLKIPKGPIKNLIQFIEDAGIIVFELDVLDETFDGITVFTDHGRPVVFIARKMPNDRKRFTLAHELAHLVLHVPFVLEPFQDEEIEANAFASEFLMPKQDCKQDFVKFSISSLGPLKRYWGVSKAALIRRAYDLKVITKSTYTYMLITLGRMGERKQETGVVEIDTPTLLKEILSVRLNEVGNTHSELQKYLCLYEDDYKLLVLGEIPRVRIMKKVI